MLTNFTHHTREKSAVEGFGRTPSAALASALEEAIREWTHFLDWNGRRSLDYVDVWWWFSIHTMRLSGSYRSVWGTSSCARTYPLGHRPLIEFLVSIPWTDVLAPARPRRLVHGQLGHLLPRSLVGNILKSDTATWRITPLREIWSSALSASGSELHLTKSGLFTAREIDELGVALRTARGATMALFPRLVQTELWLRSRPRRLLATHPNSEGGESHALREA